MEGPPFSGRVPSTVLWTGCGFGSQGACWVSFGLVGRRCQCRRARRGCAEPAVFSEVALADPGVVGHLLDRPLFPVAVRTGTPAVVRSGPLDGALDRLWSVSLLRFSSWSGVPLPHGRHRPE